ncbi:DUF262 domain-containing protein [Paenibacillus sp. TRM 82003]|nr:DUF262 domain-containing protein [Paenibacillus sp. TRM 82003]
MRAIASTFKSGEPGLPDLLSDIKSGKVQLPDFQRGWVWDDEHIRSLIASVSMSYPIGAVMMLQTGGNGVQFQPRPVQGVTLPPGVQPDYLILDGQQRMTSLFLSIYSGQPVPTRTSKGQDIERVYYLDIPKMLDPTIDRMDAVISISPERKLTRDFGRFVELDVSTVDLEYEHRLFPIETMFDQVKFSNWRRGYTKKYRNDDDRLDEFDAFESEIVHRFTSYRVPVIELLKDTPKEAVCHVFEKVNTGGVTLTVFELVTAIFAADNFNLRKDWENREAIFENRPPLKEVDATTFLTAVTLLASYRSSQSSGKAVSCKRKDVLQLPLEDYKKYAPQIEDSMLQVERFLAWEKVFDAKALPYSTQLIPLSVILAVLGARWEQEPVRRKVSQWFWSGVFGELYGGANESRFAFDVPEVIDWIQGGGLPRTIRDASFSPIRLSSLQSRLSAAYKGLMALLMKEGSRDFLTDAPIEITNYFNLSIDIHHIFPRSYCEKQNYPRSLWNSVINKAPLSASTNRALGGRAPSLYLATIKNTAQVDDPRIDATLRTHCIDPDLLRADQFDEFIRDRVGKLLNLIGSAMGKPITGRDAAEVVALFGGPIPN